MNRASVEANLTKLAQVVSHKAQKFFAQNRKGENYELKAELNSGYAYNRKDAVKKVIANMTIGKDASPLFADVVKNMQTDDIEMKKLVYLYLINYAKTQPELVILAVNTFVKDTADGNPLIRALAIRTMGCLRVSKIIDYIAEPLRKLLEDESPYVRKTAAICVAKLFDIEPEVALENGFVAKLGEMLSDRNPTVVANAIAALNDIATSKSAHRSSFKLDSGLVFKLASSLNEATEWGQITILDTMAVYQPHDEKEAESLLECVTPRLSHRNAAVVLAGARVLLNYLPLVAHTSMGASLLKKLTPPLVTLLSSPPEIAYLALRNLDLIVKSRPDLLSMEIRVLFCKYNDPAYVKQEKLDLMVTLSTDANCAAVIDELKEYASDVDAQFVKLALHTIGRLALKIPQAADKCVEALVGIIDARVQFAIQDAVIVFRDIARGYPKRFASSASKVCAAADLIEDGDAKVALLHVLGEYAASGGVAEPESLLDAYLENFKFESVQVQLAVLSCLVKLYLRNPAKLQDKLQAALKMASSEADNADLRDRAYIYWRLISNDPNVAKTIVNAAKEAVRPVSAQTRLKPAVLETLLSELSLISSVYHMTAGEFLSENDAAHHVTRLMTEEDLLRRVGGSAAADAEANETILVDLGGGAHSPGKAGGAAAKSTAADLLDLDMGWASSPAAAAAANHQSGVGGGGMGLLDLHFGQSAPSTSSAPKAADPMEDLLGGPIGGPVSGSTVSSASTKKPFDAFADLL